ncbi:hypothetical protein EF847_15615 [Actinobacteria bacterium YIM 96077]|nr:hypothetical protein EF847_15615 [Actinobacteria bacterium YIM 96077]
MRHLVIAIITAVLLLIGACAGEGGADMTEDEALERVEQHIDNAITHMTPQPRPKPRRRLDIPCADSHGRDTGLYQVERVYWLDDIPTDKNQQIFDTLHTYWTDQNYEITEDVRDRHLARTLTVRSEKFTINILERNDGRLSIRATSPCIETSESPNDT